MKLFQKRSVAAVVMVLAIVAGVLLGQVRRPDETVAPSTAVVGTYTYTYDHAHVLTDGTMDHIDAMNTSLFAQTGAQIMVVTVGSTGGQDIIDYAMDLGEQYGIGSAERNNGLVVVLALDDIAQNGLPGNYGAAYGSGLYDQSDRLNSLLYAYMEEDFAAGDYDAAVCRTVDAYMAWLADFYGVEIRENYVPVTRETFSAGAGYYTQTTGYLPPTMGSVAVQLASVVVTLLILWVLLDRVRYTRYRRRYLVPGMGDPHGAVLSCLLGPSPAAQDGLPQQAHAPSPQRAASPLRLRRAASAQRRVLWRQPLRGRQPRRLWRRRLLPGRQWRQPRWLWRRRLLPGRWRRQPRWLLRRRTPVSGGARPLFG